MLTLDFEAEITRKTDLTGKAVEALRQRLGEDAVRYFLKRIGCEDLEYLKYLPSSSIDETVRLTKLPARTAEEFVIALTNEAAQDAPHWYHDAQAPLPGDLKVLTLEYNLPDDEDASADIETLFEALGLCSKHEPGETTCFGKGNTRCLRVDVVVTASQDCDTILDWQHKHSGLTLMRYAKIDNFAHRYQVGDEYVGFDWFDAIAEEVNPELPGQFEQWARAATKRAESWLALHVACNGDIKQMLKVLKREPVGTQQFVVERLVPRGVVTLLLASKGVGKTNALLELAVAVAERRPTWWDFKLSPSDGFVVFLLGEGSIADATERVKAMNNGKVPMLLKLEKFTESTMIEDIIANLKKSGIKIDLLIVDPGRKYYRGDEDSSDAVSEFFTKLEAFADERNAGLIVSHHLKRDAKPKNIHEVTQWLRGSQVWIDRPRVIMAMHRRGDETTFGIPAPRGGDPLHNLRASTMHSDALKLRRDANTFTHVLKKSTKQEEKPAVEPIDCERVFATLKRLLEEGKPISTSSKYELFKLKPEELYGMTRTEMRAAVQHLIDDERVLQKSSRLGPGTGMLYLPV